MFILEYNSLANIASSRQKVCDKKSWSAKIDEFIINIVQNDLKLFTLWNVQYVLLMLSFWNSFNLTPDIFGIEHNKEQQCLLLKVIKAF